MVYRWWYQLEKNIFEGSRRQSVEHSKLKDFSKFANIGKTRFRIFGYNYKIRPDQTNAIVVDKLDVHGSNSEPNRGTLVDSDWIKIGRQQLTVNSVIVIQSFSGYFKPLFFGDQIDCGMVYKKESATEPNCWMTWLNCQKLFKKITK